MKILEQRALLAMIACMAVFCCATSNLLAASPATQIGYQPQQTYNGDYIPLALYYKNPESSIWQRMSKSDNYLSDVRCPAALRALSSTGQWRGHFKEDGSCGSLYEPTLFELGNRINHDAIATGSN